MIKELLLSLAAACCLTLPAEAQTVRPASRACAAPQGTPLEPGFKGLKLNSSARINVPKEDEPVFNPEGTRKNYLLAYTDNNGFSETAYSNGKLEARESADGRTLYLNGLTPGFNRSAKGEPESWLKATREGGELTVKAGQVLYKEGDRKLYFEVVQADAQGTVSTFKDEMKFTIAADGKITQADANDIAGVFVDGETADEAGFYGFFYGYAMEDLGDITAYAFPAGAETKEYLLSGTTGESNTAETRRVSLCFGGGGDCYIAGLCSLSPQEVVKGTIAGGKVTFPAFYIIHDADLFYYRLVEASLADSEGNLDLKKDGVTFTLDGESGTLAMAADNYLLETGYDLQSVAAYLTGVKLTPYAGDKPATPATPQILHYDKDNVALYVTIPATDTEGNYINPDKLAYRFYADGEPYTFTPEDYSRLTASITDIPYAFTDHYDIYNNAGYKTVFFHNLTAKEIEVESVYTVDGVANVSSRAGQVTGVKTAKSDNAARPVSVAYTDLQGRRLSAPAKNGVTLVATTYADGTVKTEKRIRK